MVTDKKFTKGEWEIFHESDGTPHIACNCEIISTINCGSYDGGKTYKPTEEENANAKLIAAAPEMYSALESSLQMLEQTLKYRNANGIRMGNVFLEATISQVKEAIKKATE